MAPYVSPQLDVVARLNTNECPVPLPADFADELAEAVRDLPLNRYPDGPMRQLREDLAAVHDHPPDGTWAANGSNEIILQLLQAYGGPGRRAVILEPTYLLHARLSWLTHTEIARRDLASDFTITGEQVDDAISAMPDIVFVCSPNNPTGNAQPLDAIARAGRASPGIVGDRRRGLRRVRAGQSALPLVAYDPNVAVVRTFSKAFAMAGARFGYVLTSPAVVEDFQRVRLPYHLSALTQAAGIVALATGPERRRSLADIVTQRDRILARAARRSTA